VSCCTVTSPVDSNSKSELSSGEALAGCFAAGERLFSTPIYPSIRILARRVTLGQRVNPPHEEAIDAATNS
jgi:hypothetical protein